MKQILYEFHPCQSRCSLQGIDVSSMKLKGLISCGKSYLLMYFYNEIIYHDVRK